MVLWVLRALFLGLLASLPFLALPPDTPDRQLAVVGCVVLFGFIVLAAEWLSPRESLTALSGLFFSLIVGMLVALLFNVMIESVATSALRREEMVGHPTVALVKIISSLVCCYVCMALVMRTKDDFRFVVPYVEFQRQTKGTRPLLLDTSSIIDGRIADVCETRVIDSPVIIPRFVLAELQSIADSADKLKRNRGRRGLDMLNRLQGNDKIELRIHHTEVATMPARAAATGGWNAPSGAIAAGGEVAHPGHTTPKANGPTVGYRSSDEGVAAPPDAPAQAGLFEDVDTRLVNLARELEGRIVTTDYNLNKMAQIRGVEVINVNDLAAALRPVILPGETAQVKIIKPGEEPGQGVGYLPDGTMVVAANCRDKIGHEVTIEVTSILQTSAGRMVFGRPENDTPPVTTTPSGKNRVRRVEGHR